jgi:small conductance mechanosensitive channel
MDFYSAIAWTWIAAFLPRLVTSVVLLVLGFWLAGWVARSLRLFLARSSHIDPTIQPVLAAITRYTILIFVFLAGLSQVGIQTASLFAVLGAAGLAVGLALQGTLTNIAAGLMLLWLRPFRINDYIEVPANNISGTVKEIGLFVCQLETSDGITIFAPNSAIWNSALKNHSRSSARLISMAVTLAHSADIGRAAQIVATTPNSDGRVLRPSKPTILVEDKPSRMEPRRSAASIYVQMLVKKRSVRSSEGLSEHSRKLDLKRSQQSVNAQLLAVTLFR